MEKVENFIDRLPHSKNAVKANMFDRASTKLVLASAIYHTAASITSDNWGQLIRVLITEAVLSVTALWLNRNSYSSAWIWAVLILTFVIPNKILNRGR